MFEIDLVYVEKLNMGYCWYDVCNIKLMFEFGYGLLYMYFVYLGLLVLK